MFSEWSDCSRYFCLFSSLAHFYCFRLASEWTSRPQAHIELCGNPPQSSASSTDCLHFSVSPAGKPRQCTHVRLSTTPSSPSRSERYSPPVSVITYTSRSLRTSLGILDLEENRTPNLILNRTEMRREVGEQGEERQTQICSSVCLEEAWLSFNHSRRKWGFCSSYFLSKPLVRHKHYTDTIDCTKKLMGISLIRLAKSFKFIGGFGQLFLLLLERWNRVFIFFTLSSTADLSERSPISDRMT